MKEIGNIGRIFENTPPMMRPLVDIPKYNGITRYINQLLLGTAPDIPSLDPHIKKYLKELQEISKRLPPKSTPISKIEYQKEVIRLIEATSYGPSYMTPSMLKTEASYP